MRRWLAPLIAIFALAMAAGPVLGLLVWTLTASPLTARSGEVTTFTLTATNLDAVTELGCLEVDLPIIFTLLDAAAGFASNGDEWEAVLFPNKVAVHSLSGGGRLEVNQSITFTILARPTQPGTWTWTDHAHPREDCTGADEPGAPFDVLVLPGKQATPSPAPTATPRPTPTPSPSLPLPSILPSLPLPPILPSPTATVSNRPDLSPAATPRATSVSSSATSEPSAGATPLAGVVATPPPGGAGGTAGSSPSPEDPGAFGSGVILLAPGEPEQGGGSAGEVTLGPLGVIDGLTVWAIPGAFVGGPGLLVILWVMIQTGVAVAWIPAVRRLRGKNAGPSRALPAG